MASTIQHNINERMIKGHPVANFKLLGSQGQNDTFFFHLWKRKIICYSQICMSRFFPDVFTIPYNQWSDFFKTVSEDNSRSSEERAQKETAADPAKKTSCIFKQNFLLPIPLLCIKTYFWESFKVCQLQHVVIPKQNFSFFEVEGVEHR